MDDESDPPGQRGTPAPVLKAQRSKEQAQLTQGGGAGPGEQEQSPSVSHPELAGEEKLSGFNLYPGPSFILVLHHMKLIPHTQLPTFPR